MCFKNTKLHFCPFSSTVLVATVLTRQGYFSTTTDAAYVWKQSKAQISKHTTKVLDPKYCSKDIMTILFSKPNLFLILPIVALRSGNLSFKKQYKTIWYYNEIYWVSPLSFCIVYNCWARAHGWWHDSGLLIFTAPQIVFFCLFSKKNGSYLYKMQYLLFENNLLDSLCTQAK